ncbi:RecA/RadA recombinase [Cenarchaeum symbiosum A]|uniref:DNA repair and recombination protein RadA n=1 Tax=Cenarchaeum symbiosum (strain A) TaxID=414004 RepID=RADA_CENSY|nr:RecName: Full=DNA repair and recombination protein RadA [Cenarchaeum symbiosum A]ABK76892.1 RecA/RadA recombinase [Cenarchaeum symbiosum A]
MNIENFDLSDLEGVGPVTKKKLEDSGVHSMMDLVVRGPVELGEISSMSSEICEKIVTIARKRLAETGAITKDFASGSEIYKRRQSIGMITTGTDALDALLGGGIETQAITEVFGEFGSGKTQFCHTMCVTTQKPKEEGGLGGGVMYIDTEGTFRPERVVTIAKANNMDPAKLLDGIIVARAYNSSHQVLILEEAGKTIQEENIKLIISDSTTGLFRSEYLGRGTLASRQQKLGRYIRLLARIAETYNCAVLATNQVSSSPDSFFGDPTRPVGGNVVGHASTYRIYFRKGGKNKRVAKIIDSPHHPASEAVFELGERGVQDTEEHLKQLDKEAKKAEKEAAKPVKKSKAKAKADGPEGVDATPAIEPEGIDTAAAEPEDIGTIVSESADAGEPADPELE